MLAVNAEPWFADWNHAVLEALFRFLPFTWWHITLAETPTYNPLASTWIFAAISYLYWRQDDDRTLWRRCRLLETAMACWLAVLATMLVRPWVFWPSPTRVPSFQALYPRYLGTLGNANCFPSHSTLVYLIVALGFAPLSRRICAGLVAFTFIAVSFPRIYLGGHYPIDVLVSAILAVVATVLVRLWCSRPGISRLLEWVVLRGRVTEILLFLWLFELGEGFRAGLGIVFSLLRAARSLTS